MSKVCQCKNGRCVLPLPEAARKAERKMYEKNRAPFGFFVLPGHESPDEVIMTVHDHYSIVRDKTKAEKAEKKAKA